MNWKTITKVKSHGGLGVRQAKLTNIAMLGKLVAEFVGNSPKLWISLLRQKYGDLDRTVVASNASSTWKALVRTYKVLEPGFVRHLGNGQTSFWYDKWLLEGPLCNLVPFVHISDTAFQVRDIWNNGKWMLNYLSTTLPEDVVNLLHSKFIWLHHAVEDKMVWLGNNSGTYSVASGYFWLSNQNNVQEDLRMWAWIWHIPSTEKCKFLCWLVLHDSLPTNMVRFQRSLSTTGSCNRCSSHDETFLHCLRDCVQPQRIWSRLGVTDPAFTQVTDHKTWIHLCSKRVDACVIFAAIWWIWRGRNHHVFNGANLDENWILRNITQPSEITQIIILTLLAIIGGLDGPGQ